MQPFYLIDTLDSWIVRSDESTKEYIALGYVWGQAKNLLNNKKLCEQFQLKGVFTKGDLLDFFPNIVKYSMAIFRMLGKRYLWVDALCIVQDDEQLMESQLNIMHRIYACASFTITVAVETSASYGLRGFKDITAPMKIRQDPIKLGGSERLIRSNFGLTQGVPASYYERG